MRGERKKVLEKPEMICNRCIYSDQIASELTLNEQGICNFCLQIDAIKTSFGTGTEIGLQKLENLIEKIKKSGKRKKFDCVVGVSGGTDSSYLLMKAVEWGLRPLAVHYDNTWNTSLASHNIFLITENLGVQLETFVVDNEAVDEIKLSFLKASVPEFDSDTDIAFVQVLRKIAAKYRIKYILEGHSYQTEGISPVSGNYLDGGYVQDVIAKFATKGVKEFPNMTFGSFLKWILLYRQKFVRPLWYIEYSKEKARYELEKKCKWVYYGGHHLENRASSFTHTYWLPRKFGRDYRFLTVGADLREGRISRESAIKKLEQKIEPDPELISYFLNRLNISQEELNALMDAPNKSWKDFSNYKKRFELLKPIFWVFMKLNLVPKTFYIKYCRKF